MAVRVVVPVDRHGAGCNPPSARMELLAITILIALLGQLLAVCCAADGLASSTMRAASG